jgi:hypothetical protein
MNELDELRLKIAKIKGWAFPGETTQGDIDYLNNHYGRSYQGIPDWPRDIAAAYELEGALSEDQRIMYYAFLWRAIQFDGAAHNKAVGGFDIAHATPEQRCRAYLELNRYEGALK